MSTSIPTSAISLLSCAHGRQRRAERQIDRRDLQSALKYGEREPGRTDSRSGLPRWKVTYDGVVYICDHSLRREITSYRVQAPSIMPRIALSVDAHLQDMVARSRVQNHPSSWTSHTVLVVDNSGSMKEQDVPGAFSRADAVWTALTLDFIGEQLERGRAAPTDLVTIVEMADSATLLCVHEPLTWSLLNSVLDLHKTRQPRSHGNYGPALEEAERLLMETKGSQCALGLLFLSDGKPSDRTPPGAGSISDKHTAMARKSIGKLASKLGRRLTIATIGFGPATEDFAVLRAMAEEGADYGAVSSFVHAGLSSAGLGQALSTLSRSLTATRTELTALGSSRQREVRVVRREAKSGLTDDAELILADWTIYSGANWLRCMRLDLITDQWIDVEPFAGSAAVSVMVHECVMGEGAERVVHRFHELDRFGKRVGLPLVAKETRFVHSYTADEHIEYHRTFMKTQVKADRIAREFNTSVAQLGSATPIARIHFLEPRVYLVKDAYLGVYGMLVEKRLDPLRYVKWNNNAGFVHGREKGGGASINCATAPSAHSDDAAALGVIGAIAESDEEGDWEEQPAADDGDAVARLARGVASMRVGPSETVPPEFVPQAFTHFSYENTRGRMMVCDLQGVLSPATSARGTHQAPTFELTDPVIHYASSSGRKGVYGRTDRGRAGIASFFETHECNCLCVMLGLRPHHPAQESLTASRTQGAALNGTARVRASRAPVQFPRRP